MMGSMVPMNANKIMPVQPAPVIFSPVPQVPQSPHYIFKDSSPTEKGYFITRKNVETRINKGRCCGNVKIKDNFCLLLL